MANKKNSHLVRISGARIELKPFVGKVFTINCFVSNTFGFGNKRLLTEVVIPKLGFYIGHAWVSSSRICKEKVDSKYISNLTVRIKKYKDRKTNKNKFGIEVITPKSMWENKPKLKRMFEDEVDPLMKKLGI